MEGAANAEGGRILIKPIDEMLRTWAAELHPPNGVGSAGNASGGSNVIAMLMATRET